MQFAPKTKEELEAINLLKPGIYQFAVASAKDRTSKNGNEMIELKLEIYDEEGRSRIIFDYLLEAMPHKLFAFCSTAEMENLYHRGDLTAQDCIDKGGYVELSIQKGGDNPQGGQYPDKNQVKRYVLKSDSEPKSSRPQAAQNVEFDEEIPF